MESGVGTLVTLDAATYVPRELVKPTASTSSREIGRMRREINRDRARASEEIERVLQCAEEDKERKVAFELRRRELEQRCAERTMRNAARRKRRKDVRRRARSK